MKLLNVTPSTPTVVNCNKPMIIDTTEITDMTDITTVTDLTQDVPIIHLVIIIQGHTISNMGTFAEMEYIIAV